METKSKMQLKIYDNLSLGQTASPLDRIDKSVAIDRTASDFDNANEKAKKIKRLI